MADFEIKTNVIAQTEQEFQGIARQISNIQSNVDSVLKATRSVVSVQVGGAINRLAICANISNCAADQRALADCLRAAIDRYNLSEQRVLTGDYSLRGSRKAAKTVSERIHEWFSDASKVVKKAAKDVKNKFVKIVTNVWDNVKDGFNKAKDFVTDTYQKVKNGITVAVDYVVDSYNNGGVVYKTIQWGKAIAKTAGGILKVGTSVVAIVGSYGTATPLSVMAIISGMNDTANGITDIVNCAKGEYGMVGETNYGKTAFEWTGSKIGGLFGNEDVGKTIGGIGFFAADTVGSLAGLQNSIAAYKQADWGKIAGIKEELTKLPDAGKTLISGSRVQRALMKKEFTNIVSTIDKTKKAVSVGVKQIDIVKKGYNAISKLWTEKQIESSDLSTANKTAKSITGIPKTLADIAKNAKTLINILRLGRAGAN